MITLRYIRIAHLLMRSCSSLQHAVSYRQVLAITYLVLISHIACKWHSRIVRFDADSTCWDFDTSPERTNEPCPGRLLVALLNRTRHEEMR